MRYLVRDDNIGIRAENGEPGAGPGAPLRPWALTSEGEVVYDNWKRQGFGLQGVFELAGTGLQTGRKLIAYDKTASLTRRRLFETALANDAVRYLEYSKDAVSLVSTNLIDFVQKRLPEVEKGEQKLGTVIRSRCFSNSGSGRLGTAEEAARVDDSEAWRRALEVLRGGGDIPKILGIQTALANVLTRDFGFDGNREALYKGTAARVSPSDGQLYAWFKPGRSAPALAEDGLRRGRSKASSASLPSTLQGVTRSGDAGGSPAVEARIRGVDAWEPMAGSNFVKGLELRNLAFGAGRSGTTGELLKTYRTFGSVDCGDSFKQYLFAIVAYLVGGGHHSCHEVFSVANLLVGSNGPRAGRPAGSVRDLVRDAYVPGKYVKHLPDSYVASSHFNRLKEQYYDIAMLGHLHGTFA